MTGSYGAARVWGEIIEKIVPKTSIAGKTTRPALSRGVGRNGEVRGVEVVLSITVMFSSGAAFPARRVVTILERSQTNRY